MAGLYIHIPYCHSKCAYCDFFSTPRIETMDSYINALITELRLRINEIKQPYTTIYIGGGTPSILPLNLLKKLIHGITDLIDMTQIQEFSIEANPEDITTEWCKETSKLGITRVSIGIQSFIDSELRYINRRHSAQNALDAISILRDIGINEISGDLIYGLPNQTIDSWEKSLEHLLSLKLPHFSAYLLSYEFGTQLYVKLMKGEIQETTEDEAQIMYHKLIKLAANYGYQHYEISNFALPGHNSIHNSNYWKDLPYLGLGVSAHSFDGLVRRFNKSKIKDYINSMKNRELFYDLEIENDDERHNDYVIVALRTMNGINLTDYERRYGKPKLRALLKSAQPYIASKQMLLFDNRLSIAEQFMLISDRIMLDFII